MSSPTTERIKIIIKEDVKWHLFGVAEVSYHLMRATLKEHHHTRDTDDHPE